MASAADVLILGGGVIGLSCAQRLLAAGRSVHVLERGTPGCGASHGNCGTLTPSHAPPLPMPGIVGTALKWMWHADAPLRIAPRANLVLWRWLAACAGHCNAADFSRATAARATLLRLSRRLIGELVAEHRLACEFDASGTLYVFRDRAEFAQSEWLPRALAPVGIPIETLSGDEVERREPALLPGVAGGYFNPDDARLRPDRYAAELARVVREAGGIIEEGVEADGLEVDGDAVRSVATARGPRHGRDLVVTLGAWTPRFAAALGIRVPIQPGKGYSITFQRPAECPRIPLVLKERSVCVTAWDSGYRLGSTMEFAGYDASLNRVRLDALRRGAAEYLHEPEGPVVEEEWYGWRPMTPDDLPMIGRVPGRRNVVLATGHGMLGVSMSAATGLLVAEAVTGQAPSLDLAPFAPGRFG